MFPFKYLRCGPKRLGSAFNCANYKYLVRKESSYVSEYVNSPVYPPIVDNSEKAKKAYERQLVHDKYKRLNTVEEKLFAINLPKYYGWESLILREGNLPYNFLPFVQYITRTQVNEVDRVMFHRALQIKEDEVKEIVEKVRSQIQEAIVFELKGRRWKPEIDDSHNGLSNAAIANIISSSVIKQINQIILSNLSTSQHLLEGTVDYDPRLEAFWAVGGFHPSHETYEKRKENKDLSEEEIEEPVEHWIQYFGSPCLQLRSSLPLPELCLDDIKGPQDELNESVIPEGNSDPKLSYGLEFERRHGTNIPGFWPGDKNEFGILSYHTRGHLVDRPGHLGKEDEKMTLHSQALLASFSWLHAQANYQGFSTFHEITYPLTTQTVITDGRLFSFYLYQLNTLLLHSDHAKTNPRTNICLSRSSLPLYKEIQGNDIVGWNDEVLATILSFYLNNPAIRPGIDLKPYLHPTERLVANIEADDRRIWLHKQFRHMYSNRPRHRLPYEIYDWERIYKIKFETRPMEARFRPFELDENPIEDRKYYEHMPPYIPKKFRSRRKHWTGWRAKFEKKFYPDV